eukprot:jgi/Psemu1/27277/gm1.27277_g
MSSTIPKRSLTTANGAKTHAKTSSYKIIQLHINNTVTIQCGPISISVKSLFGVPQNIPPCGRLKQALNPVLYSLASSPASNSVPSGIPNSNQPCYTASIVKVVLCLTLEA